MNVHTTISASDLRITAEHIARTAVINERLGGDERGFGRWAANNASYFAYRVGLERAKLDGTAAAVQAADARIAEGNARMGWRERGLNAVVSPSGVVMTKEQARKVGWDGK